MGKVLTNDDMAKLESKMFTEKNTKNDLKSSIHRVEVIRVSR